MHEQARRRNSYLPLFGMAALGLAGLAASYAITNLAGTKTGLFLAIASIGGPLLGYVAIVTPLVFPFGVYVLAVPFDNLLNLSSFGTLTKLLAILSGAAIFLYLMRTRRTVPPPPALMLWAAFYFWAAITTFWALDTNSLFAGLTTGIQLAILYAAVSVLPANRNAVNWVLFATIASGVLAASYGVYLFHNGVDIYYGGRLRITTDTGAIDPNHFAAALLLPISLTLANVLHQRKTLWMLASVGALAILFLGIGVSQSRGAVLAIGVMVAYFFLRDRAKLRLTVFSSIAAIVVLAFSAQTALWGRFGEALSSGGAGRTSIWRVGLTALKSHWLAGAGYNNFPFAYDQAFIQTSHQMASVSSWHRAPHNLLIGTSVELGVIGLALLLAAWFAQFQVLRDVGPLEVEYPLRVALEAAVLGTFFAAMFLDVMNVKYVWLTFMLMALVRNAHFVRRTAHA